MLLRIKHQEESSLSREIYEAGKSKGWPGLGSEVREICKTIGLDDANENHFSKEEVKGATFNHHYLEMKKING